MKLTTVGIDRAKNLFQVHGIDEDGKVLVEKQLRQDRMATFFVNVPPCLVERRLAVARTTGRASSRRWAISSDDGAAVCQALRQDQQERTR